MNFKLNKTQSKTGEEILIRLDHVFLKPFLHNISAQIRAGDWWLLRGLDEAAKSAFCDICFGFIRPEAGEVWPALGGRDVSFLGRRNATYGKSLMEHLICGVAGRSRQQMESAVKEVFGEHLKSLLSPKSILVLLDGKKISDLELNEKDYLEIAEANVLLQDRKALIIDTTSECYENALEQGFRHSPALLNSGRTIFWIFNEKLLNDGQRQAWQGHPEIPKISLYFPAEFPPSHIN